MEETTLLINKRIAQNLIACRKRMGWTQAELAEKINYSDKSVSKWESGNAAPDIYVLVQLAELFGVTLDELTSEQAPMPRASKRTGLHTLIMLLSSGIVWLVATCVFAFLHLLPIAGDWWLCFIFALPVNAIVGVVFASVWHYKTLNFICISTLIWTGILSLFLLLGNLPLADQLDGLWAIFLIGIPLQVLEILWSFFRLSVFRSQARKANQGELRE